MALQLSFVMASSKGHLMDDTLGSIKDRSIVIVCYQGVLNERHCLAFDEAKS
jgi:hypothetical protein